LIESRSPHDFGDLILTVPDTHRAQPDKAASRARESTWECMGLRP
jgi:hypothetical protein